MVLQDVKSFNGEITGFENAEKSEFHFKMSIIQFHPRIFISIMIYLILLLLTGSVGDKSTVNPSENQGYPP